VNAPVTEKHPSPSLLVLAIVHTALFVASLPLAQFRAVLQFGAAVPLGLFAATAFSRLQFLGVRAAGATIALYGGLTASAMMMLSGLSQWSELQRLAFATGGVGFVVPFGLLVAGVSVTAGLTRLVPRWLMIFGLIIAAFAELSTFSLVTDYATYLLPAARFPGFVWLIATGALLPRELPD
jgi:hypothetical protein